jgi:hypothetical protein
MIISIAYYETFIRCWEYIFKFCAEIKATMNSLKTRPFYGSIQEL